MRERTGGERWMRRAGLLAAALLAAFGLTACLPLLETGPQAPGRPGLMRALDRFELAARWSLWGYILENFYLPEHAKDMRKLFKGDADGWFRAGLKGAALGIEEGDPRPRICVLAMREKHVSPRFEPHFVVYYRVQRTPCADRAEVFPKGTVEGQMEWGFEVKQRRWVHLRPVG